MSKRFGRNQKRKMRAMLEVATADAIAAEVRATRAERALSDAEARAFRKFMADPDRYEAVCARMAQEVGRVAGENLKPYAEQLMRDANKYRPMVRFDASVEPEDVMVSRLTVEWPAVRYNMQIMGP
jgi:hypothetical protein